MRVAVLILNWNGASLLRRYLPRVLAATPQPWAEVIVADNASADDSLDYLEENHPEVQVIRFDRNYGFAGGYNRAVSMLNHEAVLMLNSDAAPEPGYLEPLVKILETDPYVAVCGPKLKDDKNPLMFEYAGAAGGLIDWLGYPYCRGRIWNRVEEDRGQYNAAAPVLWVSGAALMVRRQAFVDAGGFDETFFAHMEEIDFCWRVWNYGRRVVACGDAIVRHLGGATLDSANPQKTYLNFRNNLAMIVRNYNKNWWWLVIAARLLLDGVAGIRFLLQGKPPHCMAIVKAHKSFFGRLPRLLRERAALPRASSFPPGVTTRTILWKVAQQ